LDVGATEAVEPTGYVRQSCTTGLPQLLRAPPSRVACRCAV